MANREHFLLLFRSIASGNCRVWNNWRIEHPEFQASLIGLELCDSKLPFINLSGGDLRLANLCGVNFYRANLQNADLSMATLKNANLREANMKCANLFHANLKGADLRGANLSGADLRNADLTGALLKGADLFGAHIDADALKQSGDLNLDGVSRLERIALQLSRHGSAKRFYPAVLKARKAFPFRRKKPVPSVMHDLKT